MAAARPAQLSVTIVTATLSRSICASSAPEAPPRRRAAGRRRPRGSSDPTGRLCSRLPCSRSPRRAPPSSVANRANLRVIPRLLHVEQASFSGRAWTAPHPHAAHVDRRRQGSCRTRTRCRRTRTTPPSNRPRTGVAHQKTSAGVPGTRQGRGMGPRRLREVDDRPEARRSSGPASRRRSGSTPRTSTWRRSTCTGSWAPPALPRELRLRVVDGPGRGARTRPCTGPPERRPAVGPATRIRAAAPRTSATRARLRRWMSRGPSRSSCGPHRYAPDVVRIVRHLRLRPSRSRT